MERRRRRLRCRPRRGSRRPSRASTARRSTHRCTKPCAPSGWPRSNARAPRHNAATTTTTTTTTSVTLTRRTIEAEGLSADSPPGVTGRPRLRRRINQNNFNDWLERLKAKSAVAPPAGGREGGVRALLEAQKGRSHHHHHHHPQLQHPLQHQEKEEKESGEGEEEDEEEEEAQSSVRLGLVAGRGFHKRTAIMQQRRKADEHKVLAQLHPQYAQTRYRLSFLIRANEDEGGTEGATHTTRLYYKE